MGLERRTKIAPQAQVDNYLSQDKPHILVYIWPGRWGCLSTNLIAPITYQCSLMVFAAMSR